MANWQVLSSNPLSNKIKNAETIFKAFTTTKSITSLNASRAGHVLELQYGHDTTLIGASILDYRLERSRITKPPTAERNFHIFYYLISGIADSERGYLALEDVSQARYKYLGHHAQLRVGIDDKAKFSQLKNALKDLEFSRADIANICQVLAAIIHIGQLSFKSTGGDVTSESTVLVSNVETLEYIASFLGVRSNILENALSYKTVFIKSDRVTLVLDQKGARENADELARALYTLLFAWIMEQINTCLSQDQQRGMADNKVSIVDFPGFTMNSQVPTIDRLLHNSANEILYNYLLKSYFEHPMERLMSEEVTIPLSEYFDNSDTVRTLFRHGLGALSVIDDYSRRERDDAELMESFKKRYDRNPSLDAVSSKRSFTVRHFAGEVEYMADGSLLASNSEVISGDIINLFTSSSSSDFLQAVFSSSAVVDNKVGTTGPMVSAHLSSKPQRTPSTARGDNVVTKKRRHKLPKKSNACGQFVSAIDSLIDSFEGSNPYFVLCLKPNDRRQPKNIDARCLRQQIKAFSIPEIAQHVKKIDTSIFLPFNEFIRYSQAEGSVDADLGIQSERDQSIKLIQTRGWSERDARYGLSGVFLSEGAWLQLVDPDHGFMKPANRYIGRESEPYTPYGEQNGYQYDADTKSLYGNGNGDMFRFIDSKSTHGSLIHSKNVGESDNDVVDIIKITTKRKIWMKLVAVLTFWCPEYLIRVLGKIPRRDIRIAWREKLAINVLIWFACVIMVLFLVGFPVLVCPSQNVLTSEELTGYSYDNDPDHTYGAIRGIIFDLTKFAPGHFPSIVPTDDVLDYGGTDMTDLFPLQLSAVCAGTNGSIPSTVVYGSAYNYSDDNAQYHDFRYFQNDSRPDWYLEQMMYLKSNYKKAYLGYTPKKIKKLVSKSHVVASINGYLYDVTSYINGDITTRAPNGQTVDNNTDTSFMLDSLMTLFQSFNGQDITKRWQNLDIDEGLRTDMEECLTNIFMIGKVDTRNSVRCKFARYFLLAVSCFLVAVMGFKFVAALQFSRKANPEGLENFFICQVPAYTEDEESLRRAIDSLARTKYDDKRKLLFVICDGMIVGAGNDRPTPRIVLDILGAPRDVEPPGLSFESLGEGSKQHNVGKIYSGLYEVQGHIVPYIVLVKVGKPTEINRPGNRGKRDSQLLLMRFLNRVHYDLPMSPLELELYHQIQNVIGVNPAYYEFLLQVDADTMVDPDSAGQMICSLRDNAKIQALCGETALSNSKQSIITMMQVYEYYISHNLAKAFESLFGSVTCLPGCFTMYRIYQTGTGKPIFVSHPVVKDYSENRVDTLHMKNLLHLGEDRYLTTLLLKHNYMYKTKFTRNALAWTVAPDTWSVFLSQRRRWINSTVHNLFELVPMSQLCGFCCFSMRFIVLLDLFATIVQPVTVGYLVYLFYLIGSDASNISTTSIVLLCSIYGLQAFIFIFRRKWEMVGWMFFYIMSIPIFSLAVPIYSFWHMDDFSWGNTRIVMGEKGNKIVVTSDGEFDESEIPKMRWAEYQNEAWNHYQESASISKKRASSMNQTDNESFMTGKGDVLGKSVYSLQMTEASGSGESRPTSVYELNEMRPVSHTADSSARGAEAQMPSDEALTDEIRKILSTADLMAVTKRSIRQHLEQVFGVKLAFKRDYINYVTEAILTGEL